MLHANQLSAITHIMNLTGIDPLELVLRGLKEFTTKAESEVHADVLWSLGLQRFTHASDKRESLAILISWAETALSIANEGRTQ